MIPKPPTTIINSATAAKKITTNTITNDINTAATASDCATTTDNNITGIAGNGNEDKSVVTAAKEIVSNSVTGESTASTNMNAIFIAKATGDDATESVGDILNDDEVHDDEEWYVNAQCEH